MADAWFWLSIAIAILAAALTAGVFWLVIQGRKAEGYELENYDSEPEDYVD